MHDISEWMRSGVDNANDLHHAKKNSALPYSLQQPGELVDGSDRTPPAGSRPEFAKILVGPSGVGAWPP